MRALSSGVERSVRNGKAAGANPAESILLYDKIFANCSSNYALSVVGFR